MKKQHLIIILLFSFLLAVPAVQAQKKVLPAELEVELKYDRFIPPSTPTFTCADKGKSWSR